MNTLMEQTGVTGQVELPLEVLRRLYHQMLRVRAFENAAAAQLARGRLSGTLHLSSGQEAIAVGVCAQLRREDNVTSTHRGHGHCLAKGADPRTMMAELFGAESGSCKGRSGSMHIADPALGLLGANGIVGGGLPMAVGAALSASVLGDGRAVVAFFGEGAAAEGSLHESMNLAALWRLPVVFVCENNLYAELSPMADVLALDRVADLGQPFGMPSGQHDGNDVEVVHAALATALAGARAGEGPSLLEFETYRHSGHFEGDPQRYKDPAEAARWRDRDPLLLTAAKLRQRGVPDVDLERLAEQAETEMAAAAAWAADQPPATEASITTDVHAASDRDVEEGR